MQTPGMDRLRVGWQLLRQYQLRALLLFLACAGVIGWCFRPENDPTGAVVAVCATVIEQRLGAYPAIAVYTPLDNAGLSRLRSRLGRTTVVVRGATEKHLRVTTPGRPYYVDKPTGRVAIHLSVTVERVKPRRATGKFMYGDGEHAGSGDFDCKKASGAWVAEIHVGVVS